VQGTSLAQMVLSGKRASEEEVLRVATDLLAILKYLAGQYVCKHRTYVCSPQGTGTVLLIFKPQLIVCKKHLGPGLHMSK
jgi:hypothetical protein